MDCKIKHQTPTKMSSLRQPCLYLFEKNPPQTSGMAIKLVAKHQHSKKLYYALKELENCTPHKDVASPFGVLKNILYIWKSSNRMKVALGLKE